LGTIEDSEITTFLALAAGLDNFSQIVHITRWKVSKVVDLHITRWKVSKVVDTQLDPMGNSLEP